jgi:hypothetical protein
MASTTGLNEEQGKKVVDNRYSSSSFSPWFSLVNSCLIGDNTRKATVFNSILAAILK